MTSIHQSEDWDYCTSFLFWVTVFLNLGATVAGWFKNIMGWITPGPSQPLRAVERNSGLLRSTQWRALQIPLAPLISKMESISTTPRSADNPKHLTSFEQKRFFKCTSKEREPHAMTFLQREPCHWSTVTSSQVLTSLRYEGRCLSLKCRTKSKWVPRWWSK